MLLGRYFSSFQGVVSHFLQWLWLNLLEYPYSYQTILKRNFHQTIFLSLSTLIVLAVMDVVVDTMQTLHNLDEGMFLK